MRRIVAVLCVPASASAYDVVIRRTEHGIPHILARDWADMGFGYGYAFAEDNICTIAASYVTVSAERSRFFGPQNSWRFERCSEAPSSPAPCSGASCSGARSAARPASGGCASGGAA